MLKFVKLAATPFLYPNLIIFSDKKKAIGGLN